jgi:iron(III) transport system permease protein
MSGMAASTAASAAWKGVGRRPRPSVALVGAAAVVATWSALPLAFIIGAVLQAGWDGVAPLLFRQRVAELLTGTVALIVLTVPICVSLGLATAWLVERTDLPGRRLFAVLFALPLAIPAFVNSFAWIATIPWLAGLPAGVLITTLSYFPLVYLPVAAVLRRLDPGLEDVAALSGRGPWRVYATVVLPQLRLPILGGALLVGLHLLAEYGAFAMVRFETFTTAIMTQYRTSFGGTAAYVLAGVLVLACLLLLVLEGILRGGGRMARLGPGVARPPRAHLDLAPRLGAILFAVALVVLALGVPFAALVRWSIAGGTAAWAETWVLPSVLGSLGLGLGTAVVAILAALPLAILLVRYPGPLARTFEVIQYIASSLPGIVIALVAVMTAVHLARPVYQTVPLLVGAYLLLFLPRTLVTLRAGLAQVPPGLEEVAASLGLPGWRVFLRVSGRLLLPAAVAGGALVFLGIVNELTATLLLAPNGTRTLAMQFWTHTNDLDYAQAAPYAVLMVALSLPVTLLLFRSARLGSAG